MPESKARRAARLQRVAAAYLFRPSHPLPPPGILPPDAEVGEFSPRHCQISVPAVCHNQTLAEPSACQLPAWTTPNVPEQLLKATGKVLVLGPSGSGKSSLVKELVARRFPECAGALYPNQEWSAGSILERFQTAEEGRKFLGSVGMGSVPCWLKPFGVLSRGERYRANMAHMLGTFADQGCLVFDEFTSELDRDTARTLALSIGRHHGFGSSLCIFASCHEDVLQYLQPDFVVICQAGSQPQALVNPFAGSRTVLKAAIHGNPTPLPWRSGCHWFVGRWTGRIEFVVTYATQKSSCEEEVKLQVSISGSRDQVKLHGVDEVWGGTNTRTGEEVKLRRGGAGREVTLQIGEAVHGASRRRLPAATDHISFAVDPHAELGTTATLEYKRCSEPALLQSGWHYPATLGGDLPLVSVERCLASFRFDVRMEVHPEERFLATYVGDEIGNLSEKQSAASKLMDVPFDGVCKHRLHSLPVSALLDFGVGVVTGPSGSGKSAVTQRYFGMAARVSWIPDLPVLAHFALDTADKYLEAACLDRQVAMRSFHVLSGGEQARAELARLLQYWSHPDLAETPLVLDEFTSLVDRSTAKRLSAKLQEFVAAQGLRRIVIVSCHNDFVGAGLLQPDWLFNCGNGDFLKFGQANRFDGPACAESAPAQVSLAPRSAPTLLLKVRRCLPQVWQHFREYHYKDKSLLPSSVAFVGELDGRAVAFTAIVPSPTHFVADSLKLNPGNRKLFREHRTVVRPDCQGMGVGPAMCDCVARFILECGHDFTSQTVHPYYGAYRSGNPLWQPLPTNLAAKAKINGNLKFSHFFVGTEKLSIVDAQCRKDAKSPKQPLAAAESGKDARLGEQLLPVPMDQWNGKGKGKGGGYAQESDPRNPGPDRGGAQHSERIKETHDGRWAQHSEHSAESSDRRHGSSRTLEEVQGQWERQSKKDAGNWGPGGASAGGGWDQRSDRNDAHWESHSGQADESHAAGRWRNGETESWQSDQRPGGGKGSKNGHGDSWRDARDAWGSDRKSDAAEPNSRGEWHQDNGASKQQPRHQGAPDGESFEQGAQARACGSASGCGKEVQPTKQFGSRHRSRSRPCAPQQRAQSKIGCHTAPAAPATSKILDQPAPKKLSLLFDMNQDCLLAAQPHKPLLPAAESEKEPHPGKPSPAAASSGSKDRSRTPPSTPLRRRTRWKAGVLKSFTAPAASSTSNILDQPAPNNLSLLLEMYQDC